MPAPSWHPQCSAGDTSSVTPAKAHRFRDAFNGLDGWMVGVGIALPGGVGIAIWLPRHQQLLAEHVYCKPCNSMSSPSFRKSEPCEILTHSTSSSEAHRSSNSTPVTRQEENLKKTTGSSHLVALWQSPQPFVSIPQVFAGARCTRWHTFHFDQQQIRLNKL